MPSDDEKQRLMVVYPNEKRSLCDVLDEAYNSGYDGVLLKWRRRV